jgi:hypothetical protein
LLFLYGSGTSAGKFASVCWARGRAPGGRRLNRRCCKSWCQSNPSSSCRNPTTTSQVRSWVRHLRLNLVIGAICEHLSEVVQENTILGRSSRCSLQLLVLLRHIFVAEHVYDEPRTVGIFSYNIRALSCEKGLASINPRHDIDSKTREGSGQSSLDKVCSG